jgi:hypothetical protein
MRSGDISGKKHVLSLEIAPVGTALPWPLRVLIATIVLMAKAGQIRYGLRYSLSLHELRLGFFGRRSIAGNCGQYPFRVASCVVGFTVSVLSSSFSL